MKTMQTFILFLAAYCFASVGSQFLTSTPIELFTVFGISIWIPLSALTIVPLVDVLRSFTQDAAEKARIPFKVTFWLMLGISLFLAFLCVLFAGLPLPIFTGVLSAVTVGGIFDILVFRKMGQYFTNPAVRMMFSNAAATLVGSGVVLFTAFTDLVFPHNELARPLADVTVGWLSQSVFIWVSGTIIAFTLQHIKSRKEK